MLYITYNEITLKGKNKRDFETRLRHNIKNSLNVQNIQSKLKHEYSGIKLFFDSDEDLEKAIPILKKVFGITYIYKAVKLEKELDLVVDEIDKTDEEDYSLSVRRIDKKYPSTSPKILQDIINKTKKDPYKESKNKYILRITKEDFLLLKTVGRGYDGLPVGSLGKVVALISGGIDSPVAIWQMLRRGCDVIALHISSCNREEEKVKKLIKKLDEYASKNIKLIIYTREELFGTTCQDFKENSLPDRYKCVLFKSFIQEIAQDIAYRSGALGIVNGDSLGQVASQTMENLRATRYNIQLPMFSPLIGMGKEDIIKIAQNIGTFDISIEEEFNPDYIPKKPVTKAQMKKFLELKEMLNEVVKYEFLERDDLELQEENKNVK